MRDDHDLNQRLQADTADLLRVIALIAPRARLAPADVAAIDQAAAHANAQRQP